MDISACAVGAHESADEPRQEGSTETERLQTKVSGLRDVVATLERSLQRFLPT